MKWAVLFVLVSPLLAQAPRFQLYQLGQARDDQYLLDTESGRLWQIQQDSKSGKMVLVTVPYLDPLLGLIQVPPSEDELKQLQASYQSLRRAVLAPKK